MVAEPRPASPSPRKTVLRVGAMLIALGFLAALVISQWRLLQDFQWTVDAPRVALSLVALEVAWLLELSIWRFILSSLGGRLRWSRAAQTWFLANLARYIPGNIWQFVGMAELAADDGVSRFTTFTSIALHQALGTVAGLVVAATYFAVAGQGPWLDALRPLLWLAPLGLLLCQPRLLEWSMNQVLRLAKRPPIRVTLTWRQVWLLLLGYLAVWLLLGSAFALLASAVTAITPQQFLALVATWAAAYVIGYLSLFTPNGLGVREGVLVLVLGPLFPAPVPTVIALASRVWMVAGELIGAAAALVARGRAHSAPRPTLPPLSLGGEAREDSRP